MIRPTIEDSACRVCGRTVAGAQQVLSRHSTSEGVVAWVRCPCGALQARFRPYGDSTERTVASSGPDPAGRPRRNGSS